MKTFRGISTGVACVAVLVMTGCTSTDGTSKPRDDGYSVIGCDNAFEDVMGDMMRLHDQLRIDGDQEFAWIAYEAAYERYADAHRFRELVRDNGMPSVDDGLRPLRERVREARDELYRALTPGQKIYLDKEACRLHFPCRWSRAEVQHNTPRRGP